MVMGQLFTPFALYLKSVFDSPVWIDLCPGPSGRPALGIYSYGVLSDMRVCPFDMDS
jgi:hypothetical protein